MNAPSHPLHGPNPFKLGIFCMNVSHGTTMTTVPGTLTPTWAENVRIETPEQIDLDLEVAGPGSRFYAQVVDWLLKFLALFTAFILVWLAGESGAKVPWNGTFLGVLAVAAAQNLLGK